MAIRVALVEDLPDLRTRLAERLGFFPDLDVVHAAESAEAFLAAVDALAPGARPHVVLMDIELPGMSGIDATALLRERHPDVEVIMLTVFEHEDRIFAAIQAGASGYLLKDASAETIANSVRDLVGGGAPMSPAVARTLLRRMRGLGAPTPEPIPLPNAFSLTERERQILDHIVRDESEVAIADALFVSPHTVRSHVKNLYRKLHVHSRASAVRLALEHRLV